MRANMTGILKGTGAVLLLAALAGCGSGLDSGGGGGTSGGSSTSSGVRIGSGTGTSFKDGVLAIPSTSLSAGGSTSITVTIVDSTGTLYTAAPVTVNFNSPCFAAGQATIVNSTGTSGSATSSSGTVIATYTAKGCSGSDTITATSAINSKTITATGTLKVAAASLGSIIFKSATPPTMTLKGMGGLGLQQTSTVIFTVNDSVGNAVQGANVTFALVSSTGGVSLSTTTGTSDANGNVQTIVQAGTRSGPVEVRASIVVSGQTIDTNSSGLAIQSGIPSQDHFSLSVDNFNVEGYDIDNTPATITASLADRFSNPVPDGTTVSFTESNLQFGAGGRVVPSCNTANGTCTVTWSSQAPRPSDISGNQHIGFAYILAVANGEESFTDVSGDGVFDDYKTCASCAEIAEPFDDIGEIYAPSAEFAGAGATSSYVAGENYFDFNTDGFRNPPDGRWEGVNCQETVSGKCGTATSTGVGNYVCIVMSGSGAEFTTPFVGGAPATPPLTVAPAGSTVSFSIADENGNVPPSQTAISVDASTLQNGTATMTPVNSSTTYVVPDTSCAGSVADWPLRFIITITPTPGSVNPMAGSVTVSVKTPAGRGNFITIPIS